MDMNADLGGDSPAAETSRARIPGCSSATVPGLQASAPATGRFSGYFAPDITAPQPANVLAHTGTNAVEAPGSLFQVMYGITVLLSRASQRPH